ncbi:MAG TPA: cupredoxin domain-containing protein [Candidatus Limnocylindrales bacterium]|jgi:plastocyanin
MRLARPALIASIALVACLSLSACVSSAAAGWTFAPPPSVTPPPAASGSPEASGSAPSTPAGSVAPSSAAGSAAPSVATGSAAPSAPAASGGSADVTITALNIAFTESSVNAPAGKAFTIDFDNQDASVPHDVYIKDGSGTQVFAGAIVTGPAKTTYNVPSLAAGSYTFFCSIHSNMTGTLVVQ